MKLEEILAIKLQLRNQSLIRQSGYRLINLVLELVSYVHPNTGT